MSDSREAARARARELQDAHRKRDKRRRTVILLGIVGGVLVVSAVLTLAFLFSTRPNAVGPRNMLSDGIKIGLGFEAVRTPALAPGDQPVPSAPNPTEVVAIEVYYDYLCPNCGTFEERNGEQLKVWLETGAATIEYHPIAIFTAGSQYSLRAANAAACVAEFAPDDFYAFHASLFADQPAENSSGYSDDQLIDLVAQAGVTGAGAKGAADCIHGQRFFSWVKAATQRAVNGPIAGTDVDRVESTPTIVVNGQEFRYTTAFDPNEFAQFVAHAAGQTFAQNPTPTPTPTGSATPTPAP